MHHNAHVSTLPTELHHTNCAHAVLARALFTQASFKDATPQPQLKLHADASILPMPQPSNGTGTVQAANSGTAL
jgi:hypothetical protein